MGGCEWTRWFERREARWRRGRRGREEPWELFARCVSRALVGWVDVLVQGFAVRPDKAEEGSRVAVRRPHSGGSTPRPSRRPPPVGPRARDYCPPEPKRETKSRALRLVNLRTVPVGIALALSSANERVSVHRVSASEVERRDVAVTCGSSKRSSTRGGIGAGKRAAQQQARQAKRRGMNIWRSTLTTHRQS